MSFLADAALRCDSRLSSRGKPALQSAECRDFRAGMTTFFDAFKGQEALFRQAVQDTDAATTAGARIEWRLFWRQVESDWGTISRTLDHLQFYGK